MTGLGTDLAPEILAACQSGAAKASAALGQCFEQELSLSPTSPQAFRAAEIPATWHGAGLVLLFVSQGEAAVLFVSQASGLLPVWCQQPTDEQAQALQQLAEGIAKEFLPAEVGVDDVFVHYVTEFSRTLQDVSSEDLCGIPWEFAEGNRVSPALLVWPVPKPEQITSAAWDKVKTVASQPVSPPSENPPRSSTPAAQLRDLDEALLSMPPYIRSLLRIKVQLSVTLAQTSYPVKKILGLAPGSIIQFNKSCDDALELRVGEKCVGVGEAVKSGEKYGLRITSMVLPEERFVALGKQPRRAG